MVNKLGALVAAVATASAVATAPTSAQEPAFTLTIKEHQFSPTQIEIPANVKAKLIVKNEDPTPEEFESTELHREKVIPGGQQGFVFIGPLSPGTYEFFSDFNPKTARGHIIVK
jgi:plastocyanin domain-containing protein